MGSMSSSLTRKSRASLTSHILAGRRRLRCRHDADATDFPDGFLWGAATAAHQIEGGNINNDWWAFEHAPGTPCARVER